MEINSILENKFEEINGYDFYKFIFSNNENSTEKHKDFSHPNAVYLYQDEHEERLKRRVMYNDTWENDYMEYVECNPMTLCSGLAYRRNANKLDNAQQMNALIFDLDGVGEDELNTLLLRFTLSSDITRSLPLPTFLVSSGTGLHLYYVFNEPISLYPNIKIQMKSLKYDLTFKIWDYKGTTTEKQIQYQSINQGFRMVGSTNNKYNIDLRAFKVGGKVNLEYLNQYVVWDKNKVDVNKSFRPSKMDKTTAKELYPEWYQRVVIEGNKSLKKWDIKSKQGYALYNWWLNKVDEIKGGHRYFYLMCLAIYAVKCDVPKSKLKEDMQIAFKTLEQIEYKNSLTQDDIKSALETYDKEFYNFTISDIEALTDIRIERNKRNGRKQDVHLKMARYIRDEINGNKDWQNKDGRPSAEHIVQEWKKNNPQGRKADCIRATGLSKMTVYKWWK